MTNFLNKMRTAIKARKNDKGGAAIEYLLILMIIGVGLIVAFTALKGQMNAKLTASTGEVAKVKTDGT
jgi:Flp pilus assembly pilin Flp